MHYRPHHTAISVRNLDKSLDFYKTLGFIQVHRYDDPDKTGIKLKLGNYFLEVFAFTQNQNKPELRLDLGNNLDEIGMKHIALATDDVDKALIDLQTKGLANDDTAIVSKGAARFFELKAKTWRFLARFLSVIRPELMSLHIN